MPRTVDELVKVSPLSGWRRVDHPRGVGFAPADELERVQGAIEAARLTLFIQVIEIGEGRSPVDVIEDLMHRRVRQGYPGRFDAQVGGLAARGFDWTDGIANILSFFVSTPGGELVELTVARDAFAFSREASGPIADVAGKLLDGVRWLSGSGIR